MQDPSPMPFPSPRQLRAIRAWFGWSLDDAADKLGVSRNTIYIYESGQREVAQATLSLIALKLQQLDVKIENGVVSLAA